MWIFQGLLSIICHRIVRFLSLSMIHLLRNVSRLFSVGELTKLLCSSSGRTGRQDPLLHFRLVGSGSYSVLHMNCMSTKFRVL
jgi:hypothetical protein